MAGIVFVGLALGTFGFPLVLGLSWWPLPSSPITSGGITPRYIPALDNFSFAYMDWPSRVFEASELRQGRIPFWNPYSSLGLPLGAQYQNQLFFPLEWLEILSGPLVWNLVLMGRMVLAALGAYSFLRRLVHDDLAAMGGAIAYMFSAYFLWFYAVPAFANGAMMAPWLFWAATRLRDRTTRLLSASAACAIVIGLTLLTGQPQISILSLMAVGGYVLLAALLAPGGGRSLLAPLAFAASAAIGAGIASVQLGIFRDALDHGYTLHSPGTYVGAGTALLNFTIPVWPFLLGQLMWPWEGDLYPGRVNWEAFPLVVGAFGLFFLCVALIMLPHSLLRRGANGAGLMRAIVSVVLIIVAVIVSGSLGDSTLWSFPGMDRVNFPRYISPALSLCLAALIAWALLLLQQIRAWHIAAADLLVLSAVAAAAKLVAPYVINASASVDRSYLTASLWLGTVPFVVTLASVNVATLALTRCWASTTRVQVALIVCMVAELSFFVRYGLGLDDEVHRLLILVITAAGSLLVLTRGGWLVAPIMAGAALATAVIVGLAPSRLAASWDPYASPPPQVQFLQQRLGAGSQGGRVISAQPMLVPNVASGFGVAQLESLAPVQVASTARYLLSTLAPKQLNYTLPNAWQGLAPAEDYPFWPDYFTRRLYYNLLGVRYLVDAPTGWLSQHAPQDIALVYPGDKVWVYEDRQAFPRAFGMSRVTLAPSEAAARHLLQPFSEQTVYPPRVSASDYALALAQPPLPSTDPPYFPLFLAVDPDTGRSIEVWQGSSGQQYQQSQEEVDLRTTAIVEASPADMPDALLRDNSPDVRPLRIATYTATQVEVDAEVEVPTMVVLSDAYYPGWRAEIDGQARPLFRVDTALRGVVVDGGRHSVTFRYEPDGLPQLLALSAGSLAVSLLALLLPVRAVAPESRPTGGAE